MGPLCECVWTFSPTFLADFLSPFSSRLWFQAVLCLLAFKQNFRLLRCFFSCFGLSELFQFRKSRLTKSVKWKRSRAINSCLFRRRRRLKRKQTTNLCAKHFSAFKLTTNLGLSNALSCPPRFVDVTIWRASLPQVQGEAVRVVRVSVCVQARLFASCACVCACVSRVYLCLRITCAYGYTIKCKWAKQLRLLRLLSKQSKRSVEPEQTSLLLLLLLLFTSVWRF